MADEEQEDWRREMDRLFRRLREIEADGDIEGFFDSLDFEQGRLLVIAYMEDSLHVGLFFGLLLKSLSRRFLIQTMEMVEEFEPWLRNGEGFLKDCLYSFCFRGEEHPEIVSDFVLRKIGSVRDFGEEEDDSMRCTLLGCVSLGSPEKALALLESAGFVLPKYRLMAMAGIGSWAHTAAQRDSLLRAMRNRLPLIGSAEMAADLHRRLLQGLGSNLGGQLDPEEDEPGFPWNFDAAMKWLESADLDQEEKRVVISSFGLPRDLSEAQKWLDWMMIHQSPEDWKHSRISCAEWWAQNKPLKAKSWLCKLTGREPLYESAVCAVARGAAFSSMELGREIAGLLPSGPVASELIASLPKCFEHGEQWRAQFDHS